MGSRSGSSDAVVAPSQRRQKQPPQMNGLVKAISHLAIMASLFACEAAAFSVGTAAAFVSTPSTLRPMSAGATVDNVEASRTRSTRRHNNFAASRAWMGHEQMEEVVGEGDGDGDTELAGMGGSAGKPFQDLKTGSPWVDVSGVATKGGDGAPLVTPTAEEEVQELPETGCLAGFQKWMLTLRRRMFTKEDWLHVHAASGLLYQSCGSLWLLNMLGMELFTGVPQLETDTPVALFILGAGLVNTLSSIPMANTRAWILNGVFPSMLQLWCAWYVSGAYPAFLATADPFAAAASSTTLVIAYAETEENIASDNKERELERTSDGRAVNSSGHVLMREGDYAVGNVIRRFGSLAALVFNSPHLYATFTGSGWVERLGEAYPAAPAMMFHAYFALATSSSIVFLATTLYTRRLIDMNYFAAIQFLPLAPFVTFAIDVAVMGPATTGNPLEPYLAFLH